MPETTNPQADDVAARLEAVLTERFTELGNPFSEMRRQEKGPDGWPASHPVGPHHVAEVLRELLAAAPASPSAPADRAELRYRIAKALLPHNDWEGEGLNVEMAADAVLAVLPPPANRTAVLAEAERQERYAVAIHDAMEEDLSLIDEDPVVQAVVARAAEAAMAVADAEQAADRAAVLREAADEIEADYPPESGYDRGRAWAVEELRRLADEPASVPGRVAGEAQQDETQADGTECANCWREVENRSTPNMGGPPHDNWVHVPGGFTACFPQRGADSPRAEPRPAVVSQPAEEPTP
jgi:hypothetical protein